MRLSSALLLGAMVLGGFSLMLFPVSLVLADQPHNRTYPFLIKDVSADVPAVITETALVSDYDDSQLALAQNGVVVYAEDHVSHYLNSGLVGGVIKIERAPLIHMTDGKKKRDIRSWATTISQLFDEQKVPEIGTDDRVSLPLDGPITNNIDVTITRVSKTTVIEKEKISFVTIEKTDPNMYRGTSRVDQKGHDGQKTRTFEVVRENGVEVSRRLQKTEITVQKEDRIEVKGTKIKVGRTQAGGASWYKSVYQAASNMLPRGTNVRVTNTKNGKQLFTTIDDHMAGTDKVIDLNPSLFTALGASLSDGVQPILVEEVLN